MTHEPSVSARDAEHALRTALSRGGEWAEVFWERHETLQLVFDDNRVEDAIGGVDQGAGIRVTTGERTTYANGNVADADDLIALAARYVDEFVTVADSELERASYDYLDRLSLLVEPSGAAPLAAVRAGKVDLRGGKTVLVVSGGNATPALIARIVGRAGSSASEGQPRDARRSASATGRSA